MVQIRWKRLRARRCSTNYNRATLSRSPKHTSTTEHPLTCYELYRTKNKITSFNRSNKAKATIGIPV